jgi:hypothetical protein
MLNWTPKICVQHIWKTPLRVLLLLNPYSLWTNVSELDYKRSTFSPLQFTHAYIVSKILVRSKDFLLFGNFEKWLILYSAKKPIIFQKFWCLFLELCCAEAAPKIRYIGALNTTFSVLMSIKGPATSEFLERNGILLNRVRIRLGSRDSSVEMHWAAWQGKFWQ